MDQFFFEFGYPEVEPELEMPLRSGSGSRPKNGWPGTTTLIVCRFSNPGPYFDPDPTISFYRNFQQKLKKSHNHFRKKRCTYKTSQDKTSQWTKRPKGQNIPGTIRPRDNTSQGTKRSKGTNEAHYLTCVANYLI